MQGASLVTLGTSSGAVQPIRAPGTSPPSSASASAGAAAASSGGSSTLKTEGLVGYVASREEELRSYVLSLNDDGSLYVFAQVPQSSPPQSTAAARPALAALAPTRPAPCVPPAPPPPPAVSATAPSFPIDFFESARCVTGEVALGGDLLAYSDPEAARISLATENQVSDMD